MTDTTHDPLCDSAKCTRCYGHFAYCSRCQCECELIARVRAEYVNPNCVWGMGECVPGCPSCKRMDDLINERQKGEEEGRADERECAAERVAALPANPALHYGTPRLDKSAAVAAARGKEV